MERYDKIKALSDELRGPKTMVDLGFEIAERQQKIRTLNELMWCMAVGAVLVIIIGLTIFTWAAPQLGI